MHELNFEGLIAGGATFLIIWLTRYACIKGEYHLGQMFRYVFLVLGVAGVIASFMIPNVLLSAIFSIFGFANLWGIHEVIEQKERVRKGWYPKKQAAEKKDK